MALTAGHRHEALKAEELIEEARGPTLVADTGYDTNRIVAAIEAKGMQPCIYPRPQRTVKRTIDRDLYRLRYLVECCFHQLKRFRALATRYEKTASSYLALVHIACAWLWLN